jgi:HlyD family secretion protein
MTRNKVLIALAVVAVLALVVWGSMRTSTGKGPAVELEKVGTRTVVAKVKGTGEINPRTKVEVQAKVIGEIVALPVREGDAVKTGQVVVEIEKQQYLAARDQAKALLDQATINLERAKVERANAELTLTRSRQLLADGVVSQEALERAQLAAESAEIAERAQDESIRQARSAYERALDELARTTIRSPMDGIVTALNVEKGETAMMGTMNFSGSVLMVIGDLSELLAEVEVAESEVVQVALGQEATVKVDALPDTPLGGKVVEIGSSGIKTGDVVKFRVKVALAAPDPRVKPGMTAKVEIRTATAPDVVAVPLQAVQSRWLDGKDKEVERKEGDTTQHEVSAVYLFADGKAQRREVKTGIQDELWVEVREGLKTGEEVVTGPYKELRKLKDGDQVRRQPTRTPAPAKS